MTIKEQLEALGFKSSVPIRTKRVSNIFLDCTPETLRRMGVNKYAEPRQPKKPTVAAPIEMLIAA